MNTHIIDSPDQIKILDKGSVLESIENLPNQCLHAWEDASKVTIPDNYSDIENVVMCGMGGSGLGARIIESVYAKTLKYPIIRVNEYRLPGFVNKHSLVICSSYSGNTEETVANAKRAIESDAKIIIIASGGTLIEIAKSFQIPYYQINAKYNPSNQPRMAIGYSVIGQLTLASKCQIINIENNEVETTATAMRYVIDKNDASIKTAVNPAKKLASNIFNKIILFISAEHLIGAAHTINNQFNENSKNLTFDFPIPELNHHLMEGLKHPVGNQKNIDIIIFNSDLYEDNIRKRIEITKDVIKNNNISYFEVKPKSTDMLSQVFESIQFGTFVNFYLSMLYKQDPSPIPWVDYFKKRMEN